MSNDQQDVEGGPYSSAGTRRSRRGKQAIIGGVGLVAMFGVGAIAAHQMSDPAVTTAAGAPAPADSYAVTPSVVPSAGSASPRAGQTVEESTPKPRTSSKRVAATQGKAAQAAKEGRQVSRPLPDATVAEVSPDEVTVTKSGDIAKDRATFRLVSARRDLTGQRELAWIADKGVAVGEARCTQKIRLSNNAEPRVRPTLLLCWRTSATRSVYTVAVDLDNPPSKKASAAAINKEWAKLR